MPPLLALFIYAVLLLWLMRRDPAKDPKVSSAVWIPFTWLLILAARLPSQWFGTQGPSAFQAAQDGNQLDRVFYVVLMLLAVRVAVTRKTRWGELISQNLILSSLVLLGLLSVLWSDFPGVTMRRWVRDLGGYFMIAVILSESNPMSAVQTVLRRVSYVLIPLSVILIKYFPGVGRGYETWTGATINIGATLNKNSLGVLCFISGLFFVWDFLKRWRDRSDRATRRVLAVDAAFIGMTLWLLSLAGSSTSDVCFFIGCVLLIVGHLRVERGSLQFLKVLIPATLVVIALSDWLFDIREFVTKFVGRDTTFTGRVELWEYLDSIHTNWLLGSGYESFWLGPRLLEIWARFPFGPNQAHNGYREVQLNLGVVGLFLVIAFLIVSFSRICKSLRSQPHYALLSLSIWIALVFYNITEAALRMSHLLWLILLMGTLTLPKLEQVRSNRRLQSPAMTLGRRPLNPASQSETTGYESQRSLGGD